MPRLLAALTGDPVLARTQPEQTLVSRLFALDGGLQLRFDLLRVRVGLNCLVEMVRCRRHMLLNLFDIGDRIRVLGFRGDRSELLESRLLGISQNGGIARPTIGFGTDANTSQQLPGPGEDLLLEFLQLLAGFGLGWLLTLLLLLLRFSTWRRGGRPIDLIKRPDFGKVHIAVSLARLTVRSDVLSPEMEREQLIRLRPELLHRQQLLERLALAVF